MTLPATTDDDLTQALALLQAAVACDTFREAARAATEAGDPASSDAELLAAAHRLAAVMSAIGDGWELTFTRGTAGDRTTHAWHEVHHLAAAVAAGLTVTSVAVADDHGEVELAVPSALLDATSGARQGVTDELRAQAAAVVATCLAPAVADASRGVVPVGCGHDLRRAVHVAHLAAGADGADALLATSFARALAVAAAVRESTTALKGLVALLTTTATVPGSVAMAIVRGACPTLNAVAARAG